MAANVMLPLRYNQGNLGYSCYRSGATYFSGMLRSGIAAYEDGVRFLLDPIRDTFCVISVGAVAGVKVATSRTSLDRCQGSQRSRAITIM